ncbi:fluoride efflux transporter FluC [Companilactobacillus sp. DQM5]|uniref:fluoride efflux transporter FluC n=1 Tax=Companilactobacillus sp. DQM5 TaxID=3463359 RepID=UPI0040589DDA
MTVFAIAIFGGFGGICRYLLGLSIPSFMGVPVATLIINSLGSFLLPIWNNYFGLKFKNIWTLAIGTGFIGSFTTFSGLMLDILKMYLTNNYSGMILYTICSIILGFFAAILGMKCATSLSKEPIK